MNKQAQIVISLVAFVCFCLAVSHGQNTPPPAAGSAPAKIESPRVQITNALPSNMAGNTNLTDITALQLRMDTDKRIAYFDGNVLVIDPSFQLRSNRLIVYLNQNGPGMEHAEAYDDVIIVQETEKRKAHSQKAVYTAADGKIVLTGDPSVESDKGITRGQVITIFKMNNYMIVEGGTRTILDLSTPSSTNAAPAAANTNAPAGDATPTNAPPHSGTN